ncbi:hypothetical protein C4D60_Mb10t28330 [Musa balbisiana]|uniref:Uncharacterized protein n=1 Tax=Musa balbisiana TaxID=52838 RepID=A0A4S8J0E4_MUSBA|nr:hypothetical protein C4D60_Mb10t28330 [Musa balbisiana]
MRTVVKTRASLLLTLVIIVFLVTARGETTPVKEAKAEITYPALRPSKIFIPYKQASYPRGEDSGGEWCVA